jgi:multidrug efflux pump subunit AcrA (membrane-fusion protein)
LGVILAGVFTSGSLTQMKTSGFEVALFPYESIVAAFASVGITANFDEETPDSIFQNTVNQIEAIPTQVREQLKQHLVDSNQALLEKFFSELQATLDRQIYQIILIPLHGQQNEFATVAEAIAYVKNYREDGLREGEFKKYEVIVRYSNDDKIDATFQNKEKAVAFLLYIQQGTTM